MNAGPARVLAGIDLGTLTCRLLIATVTADGALTERYSDRRVLRLGEGFALHRRLSQAAITRVIAALRDWRRELEAFGVERDSAVATSAVREASNREEFLQRARLEAGFEVEVLTGEEEARRTMLGIRSGLPTRLGTVLGLDIGGGSTEFILHRSEGSARDASQVHSRVYSRVYSRVFSMDVGVVRLTEELFAHDPPGPEELGAARDSIQAGADQAKRHLGERGEVTLVGTAGTVTTLAAMAQGLPEYDSARIHNYVLSLSTICELEDALVRRSTVQRRGMPGLEPGREDVILAGTLILRGIMEAFGLSTCLVSDLGLREGIVLHLAQQIRSGVSGPR